MLRFLDDFREVLGLDRKHTPPKSYKPINATDEEIRQCLRGIYKSKGWQIPPELEQVEKDEQA